MSCNPFNELVFSRERLRLTWATSSTLIDFRHVETNYSFQLANKLMMESDKLNKYEVFLSIII